MKEGNEPMTLTESQLIEEVNRITSESSDIISKQAEEDNKLTEDDIRRSIKELNHMSEWLDGMIYEDYPPLVCFAIGIALTSISTIRSQLRDMLSEKSVDKGGTYKVDYSEQYLTQGGYCKMYNFFHCPSCQGTWEMLPLDGYILKDHLKLGNDEFQCASCKTHFKLLSVGDKITITEIDDTP